MFGWYSIVPNNFWGWKKQKPFLHLSLSKAGPFTLENHICFKALKRKVFQIIRCLIKPLLKNSIQTIFQGRTSWVAQLLNNMNVWMVLYCAQQLLGLKKQKPSPIESKLKWIDSGLKSIESTLKSIESKLKSIESKLKSIENQLISIENQLISIESKLKSIESKLFSIESKLKSIKNKYSKNMVRGGAKKLSVIE